MHRILITLTLAACLLVSLAQAPAGVLARSKAPAPSPTPSVSPTPNPLERIATLQQTVKDNPNDIQAREELGVLLVQNGKPADGRDQLENAIRLGSKDAEAWFYVGIANSQLHDEADAVLAFEKAEILDPDNLSVLSELGNSYLTVGRIDDALRIANRTVTLHPKEVTGYILLGSAQLSKGLVDEGRKNLFKALTIDAADYRAHMMLGRSYIADKHPNPDLAIEQFDVVLKASPSDVEALRSKAQALALKNDVPGAVALLQQVVKLQPDSVEAEDDIAELYTSKHMMDQAHQAFAQAIKDHPKATEPLTLQAESDINEKHYSQAAQEYESALAIAPDDPRILYEYGRLQLLLLKSPQKALDAFRKILAKQPDNADTLFIAGQTYAEMGNWTQARDYYRKTFEITRAYVPLFNLAYSFYQLKDYKDARDALGALALHQDPKHPDAQVWLLLGHSNRLLGDKPEAIAAYNRFLAIVHSGQDADKARAYIKQLNAAPGL